jgi:GT2 family glycosyltransferase
MLISYMVACKGRAKYLRNTLPTVIATANASPPVELVIVDYDSPDDLDDVVYSLKDTLQHPNYITYVKVSGKPHWHLAHARNVGIRAAHGDYIFIASSEISFRVDFIENMRQVFTREPYKFMSNSSWGGMIACSLPELIEAGGFDERFEYYGTEDYDLIMRLKMRGIPFHRYSRHRILSLQEQTEEERFKYYRFPLGKRRMTHMNKVFFEENIANNVLVVNVGQDWGKYDGGIITITGGDDGRSIGSDTSQK